MNEDACSMGAARDIAPSELVSAAASPAGLELLLLLAREPMACETADGFALRLQRPVAEVRQAVLALAERGLLCTSRRENSRRVPSYWLPGEVRLVQALQQLAVAYRTDAATRRSLRQAVVGCVAG